MMQATILLADAAQTDSEGKMHALGLGWSTTTTPLPPQAVVLIIQVPWDLSNEEHTAVIELVSEDGSPVRVPGPVGDQPMRVEAQFETGRPPGTPRGSPLTVPLTFGVAGGLPLPAGRYEWRLTIDEESQAAWHADFLVR